MICSPGDLVGIPFPYSDESARKRRPVLVVTCPDSHGDFMGLAVTSVPTERSAIRIDDEAMKSGHLPKQSWIRIDKIFTLSETSIVRNYGTLDTTVFQEVVKHLCRYIGCGDP